MRGNSLIFERRVAEVDGMSNECKEKTHSAMSGYYQISERESERNK